VEPGAGLAVSGAGVAVFKVGLSCCAGEGGAAEEEVAGALADVGGDSGPCCWATSDAQHIVDATRTPAAAMCVKRIAVNLFLASRSMN